MPMSTATGSPVFIDIPTIKRELITPLSLSEPSNKCGTCAKKLKLTDMACKCQHRFCALHRMPETHACTFDFHGAAKTLLQSQNPVVVGKKVDQI
jgi:hypothetical protein